MTHPNFDPQRPDCLPPATRQLSLPGDYGQTDFVMRRGGRLTQVQVGYESWGALSRNQDNAVLIFTGLSPTAHAASCPGDETAGWWEYMIGPGKPIDTDRFYVVCVNSLGSCFGSTGPASLDPTTGEPYRLTFPELAIEDIAKAGHHAMRELGVDRVHAVVGPSMGGMSALAYALQYPDELEYLAVISAACRALPFTIAVRSLQREIIRCDPHWHDGDYDLDAEPFCGMRLARKLGLMSYRAAAEWQQRFSRARVPEHRMSAVPFGIEFEIESYLEHNAQKFVRSFDANSYLYLSRALDLFDVAEHGGSVNAGLAKVHAKRTLVVGVESDILFPVGQQAEIVHGLRKAGREVEFTRLESIQGHDSFLVDAERFAPVLRNFLDRT